MFQRRLNEVRVRLLIAPHSPSPLLIKAAGNGPDGQQMSAAQFVQSGKSCFIPGSSLHGMFRTAATQVVSRWQPGYAVSSDPFSNHVQQWIDRQANPPDSADIYRMCGPIERSFGIPSLAGRWRTADAWPSTPGQPKTTTRPSVGIDRKTGSVHLGATFSFEPVAAGVFDTTLTIVNYELWHLGLLAHVLAQLDGGGVRVGYGKRRGFGQARIEISSIVFRWYGYKPSPVQGHVAIPPLADLAQRAGLAGDYGWKDGGTLLSIPQQRNDAVQRNIGWQFEFVPELEAKQADASGLAPPKWLSSPWPEMANLLQNVMPGWAPSTEALQREADSAETAGS